MGGGLKQYAHQQVCLMILVDTSVWIDFLDGTKNRQTDYLSTSLESEIPIFYTGIILQEILQGFNNKKQQAFVRSFRISTTESGSGTFSA